MIENPHHFFIAVGIDSYYDPRWQNLIHVPYELGKMETLFTERLNIERVLTDQSKTPQRNPFLEALNSWVSDTKRQCDDQLIIYWTGHAEDEDDKLYLVLPDSTKLVVNGLDVLNVIDILLGSESRLQNVLLILDVCYAGKAAENVGERLKALITLRSLEASPNLVFISATTSRETAEQKKFVDAFVEAVERSIAQKNHFKPALNITEICSVTEKLMSKERGQKPHLYISAFPDSLEFLPNPYYVPHLPSDIGTETQKLLLQLDEKARGVASPENKGWFFRGRKQVFVDLCAWLKDESRTGLCRITGGVGAGKSAVLGRLYTLSLSNYLEQVPDEVLSETELPPTGSINAAVILSRKTRSEGLAAIAKGFGVIPGSVDELVSTLSEREYRSILLVDGLDEADAPRETLNMLEQLAKTCLKVIVGVRAGTLDGEWSLEPELDINLDKKPWVDIDAVKQFVLLRLKTAVPTNPQPIFSWQSDLSATSHALAGHANGNFLVAHLSITALLAGSIADPCSMGWTFPGTVGEAYDRILDSMGDDEPAIRDLLLALAYAEGSGLPEGPLWISIAKQLSNTPDVKLHSADVFRKTPWFVRDQLHSGQLFYHLFHDSLREHLRAKGNHKRVHEKIVEILQNYLDGFLRGEEVDPGVIFYIRQNLIRHIRHANALLSLRDRILQPEWVAVQIGDHPLKATTYETDIAEMRTAASEANMEAIEANTSAPCLDLLTFSLIWRSAIVTIIGQIPPAGFALWVRTKWVKPEVALQYVISQGEEESRAIRLAALAGVVQGEVLDDLLNYAAGIKTYPDVDSPNISAGDSSGSGGSPITRYEQIWLEALRGPDKHRIAYMALKATNKMTDYGRWLIIAAVVRDLSLQELKNVPELIDSMGEDSYLGHWRSLAFSAYSAECVRRGEQLALKNTLSLTKKSLTRWFTIAALFKLHHEDDQVQLPGLSLSRELALLDEYVKDWLQHIELKTAFISNLPDVSTNENRRHLAGYLLELHGVYKGSRNAQIEYAVAAGECLPDPHGSKLLLWAKSVLNRNLGNHNINWYFTPSRVANALARMGYFTEALNTVALTMDHPFLRPKALAEVICASGKNGQQISLSTTNRFKDSMFDQLQLLCTGFECLSEHKKNDVLEKLESHTVRIAPDILSLRCHVKASLIEYIPSPKRGNLFSEFRDMVVDCDVWCRNKLFVLFAGNCAATGNIETALDTLSLVEDEYCIIDVWMEILLHSEPENHYDLIKQLACNEHLYLKILEKTELIDVVARTLVDTLEEIESYLNTNRRGYISHSFELCNLIAAMVVRAFELGNNTLVERLLDLAKSEYPLRLLKMCCRLSKDARIDFITTHGTYLYCHDREREDDKLCPAIAAFLIADDGEVKSASEELLAQLLRLGKADLWIVKLLTEDDQERFINATFEVTTESLRGLGGYSNGALEWYYSKLNAENIECIVGSAKAIQNDYDSQKALLKVLPHYAELHGYETASCLKKWISRTDFEALSWAALMPHANDSDKKLIFRKLMPDFPYERAENARALGNVSHLLTVDELIQATRWIVMNHSVHDASRLNPLVKSAIDRTLKEGYAVLDAIMLEASRLPCAVAMDYLIEAIPLITHLGGREGLEDIDRTLDKVAGLWP